jgi:hypothetical protein
MNKIVILACLAVPTIACSAGGGAPAAYPLDAALPAPRVAAEHEVVALPTHQETTALSDAACEDDTLCALAGLCSAEGSECIAGDDAECRQSQQCLTDGACTARGGECVATSNDECSASEACLREGRCTARAGQCAV